MAKEMPLSLEITQVAQREVKAEMLSHQATSPCGGSTAGGSDWFASCTHWSFFPKNVGFGVFLLKGDPSTVITQTLFKLCCCLAQSGHSKPEICLHPPPKLGVGPDIRQTVLGMTKIIKIIKSVCNVSGIFFNDKNIAQHFLG